MGMKLPKYEIKLLSYTQDAAFNQIASPGEAINIMLVS